MSSHKIFVQNYFYDLPIDIILNIYNLTIPTPPLPPPITKKYSLDFNKLNYMDELVLNYPTSFVLRKSYNNIRRLFDYYFRNFIIKGISIPFPDLFKLNKQIYEFCDNHSTYRFKINYSKFKHKQTYINRFNINF